MNWGLTQGLIGRAQRALTPSGTALGPNTYLRERDFLKMLGVAFGVHVFAFGVAAIWPRDTVTNIPVRALSFKLGNDDKVAAYATTPVVAAAPAVPAPVMQAVSRESWRATPNTPSPVVPEPLKPVEKPEPKQKPVVKQQPKVVKVEEPKPAHYQQQPAVAPTPQQYVREVGAPSAQVVAAAMAAAPDGAIGGQGATTSMTETTAQAVRARYTQEISSWIQRHKYYPAAAGGREGRAVVRLRIDRMGNVRYYAIEQSAGMQALDDAALDMMRRANPVPQVPDNYPAGNLVEFLIPITFKAPL